MKGLFDEVSAETSRITTKKYSTSFSMAIHTLHPRLRQPIYSIYGYVRLADEIVDSFHDFNKHELMQQFRTDTLKALEDKISLNPILNSFQKVVREYNIEWGLIDTFLKSMEMDLEPLDYDQVTYEDYILGSAEVVGLMCLRVFVENDSETFDKLRPSAMHLGAAFQKVNFLRDIKADYETLGRTYFPQTDLEAFTVIDKQAIEKDIEEDLALALVGIKQLPSTAQSGVHLAYKYYLNLFRKIQSLSPETIRSERVRIPNSSKFGMMLKYFITNQINML